MKFYFYSYNPNFEQFFYNSNGERSEIHDLHHPQKECQPWPNYSIKVKDAAGGLLQFSKPVICGGFDLDLNEHMKCHILDPSGNETTIDLIHPRTYSAAVALTDNLLWVTGGTGHPTSTEFIDLSLNSEISRLGPDLPIGFDRGAYTYDIEPIQYRRFLNSPVEVGFMGVLPDLYSIQY